MTLKNIFIQLYFFLSYLLGFGQTLPYTTVAPLPEDLTECSGMARIGSNALALINDSGNAPELFVVDTTGQLLQRLTLPELQNVDWEALAVADSVLFIGDFGNNANKRKDLMIYRLDISALLTEGQYQVLEPIQLRYANQKAFPPHPSELNFDMEAMVAYRDSLYLFSKNRTQPFDGYTYAYVLPQSAGTYQLNPYCSMKMGNGIMPSYWITGATYAPEKRQLALLGYDKLWIIKNSAGSCLLEGQVAVYYFNQVSQKEALSWVGNQLYWADENNGPQSGNLYKTKAGWQAPKDRGYTVKLQEKTILNDTAQFEIELEKAMKLQWEVFSMEGKRNPVGNQAFEAGTHTLAIDLSGLPPGTFVINLILNGQPNAYFIKKVYRQP